jgi:hypothetical protein
MAKVKKYKTQHNPFNLTLSNGQELEAVGVFVGPKER